jgi:GH24 family phage-related lysozyme (muramidase)
MWEWIQKLMDKIPEPKAVEPPRSDRALVGAEALDLILEFEGIDQPWLRPPGMSGVSLGYGYDCGYVTREEFREAWGKHLSVADFSLISGAIGKKGAAAESYAVKLTRVKPITRVQAREVFDRCTLPKWTKLAAKTFPGLEVFTPNQQGVLVSLVFNRGTDLEGDRRKEMKAIRNIIMSRDSLDDKVKKITNQFYLMQRVWPSNSPSSGHPGLRRRRRAEAALFERG